MRRMVGLVIVGLAARTVCAQQPSTLVLDHGPAIESQAAEPPPTVAERAEFYQRVAATRSTRDLEKLARDLAALPWSAIRQSQLELIVDRHFELDPAGAVRVAGELFPATSPGSLAALYERLARADVNAALGG